MTRIPKLTSQILVAFIPGVLVSLFSAGIEGKVNLYWVILSILITFVGILIYDYVRGRKRLWRAASLNHKLGRKYGETEWGASVPSIQDHLVYGQYIDLPPGKFTAIFRLKVEDNASPNADVALLDVVCSKNKNDAGRIIAKRIVRRHEFAYPKTYDDFPVQFTLDKRERRVEFRVWFANTTELVIDTIELQVG